MSQRADTIHEDAYSAAHQQAESPDRTDFPCSVAQERFWLLDRLDPGNPAYNVAVRWRIEGRIVAPLLERAWLAIIDRHEILRSQFFETDGVAVQRVLPASRFRLSEINLSTLSADQQLIEADRIGAIEARAPFDLTSAPLIRVTLLRFSPTSAVILVTTHQIVSDGWSIGVMAREMGVIYSALRNNDAIPLEPLTIQYADYSLWQLEWMRVQGTAAESEYWAKHLAGVKPFKIIPDHPRPGMPTTNGAILSRVLPRTLTDRAQALCVERGATLFSGAFGALCAMLARYANETDIVVGTQVSDRDQVETEPMIGQFVNSLVLRNDLSGNPSLSDVIDRIKNTTEQALEHRHIPIEQLLDMVKGEFGKTNAAPISVNFIFQKTFIRNTTYPEFSLADMPSLPAGAIYDLNFFMVERLDGWRFSLQYNTDQFEYETAQRFLGYFQNVLETMVTDPQRRLADVHLGAEGESRQLIDKLNAPAQIAQARTAIELFIAQAAASPNTPALVCAGEWLTYQELVARADVMAVALRTRGIGLGSRVALCMPRTPDMIAVVLSLMKIGAGCLLMDPADDVEFQRRTLQVAKVSALIVNKVTRGPLQNCGVPSFEAEALAAQHQLPPPLAVHPGVTPQTEAFFRVAADRIAGGGYSLSQITLGKRLAEIAARIELDRDDVFVATAPLGLNIAVDEILLPLTAGAVLVLATADDQKSGPAIQHLLKRTDATAIHAVNDAYADWLGDGWVPVSGLKVLVSGDPLEPEAAQEFLNKGTSLWTVFSAAPLDSWTAISRVRSPSDIALVGIPLDGAKLNVTDALNQVTDIGASGDLSVSYDAADPTHTKTGDVARLRADGQIEWLKRGDRGFQIRGRRIDPARIEAVLKARPAVRDAIVVKGGPPFTGRLVACVSVPGDDTTRSAVEAAVNAELERYLPRALAPTVLVTGDSLPLDRDGTLNWRALKLRTTRSAPALHAIPLAEVEESIAAIWRSLLKLDHIDPNANFFELGSHSLLAARMLSRIETTFGRKVTLNALFRAPTIRELALLIGQKDSREFDFRQMVKLQANGSRPPLIAINNTGMYYPLAKRLGQDQPFISLQLFDPAVKTSEMPQTLEEVAAGYVQLINRVQPDGPYNLMGWCVAGALTFEIARQLLQANKQVTSLFLMDSWLPRYIQRQPPLRRLISEYSLRWQIVRADWRLVEEKRQVIGRFLKNRNSVKALRTLWNRICMRHEDLEDMAARKERSREDYDKWLLHYLQSVTAKYEPRKYSGPLTLFRSLKEPTGWRFDPLAGWGAYADSVELVMVSGDHYSMFQESGAQQMAQRITDILAKVGPVAESPGSVAG